MTKQTTKTKAPKAKKAAAPTKAAIALRMLTAPKGTTRGAIVEATGWGIDLRQFCTRKGLKVRKAADGTLFATPIKAA